MYDVLAILVAAQQRVAGSRSSDDLIVGVCSLGILAKKFVLASQFLEASTLTISHVLVDQPARIRDLPLLVHIVVLYGHSQLVFVGLN